jgi:hypothetical protein
VFRSRIIFVRFRIVLRVQTCYRFLVILKNLPMLNIALRFRVQLHQNNRLRNTAIDKKTRIFYNVKRYVQSMESDDDVKY